MLYTIVGDPHAKPDNLDKINQLFDIIEDLGNTCIFLGDLLDTKELVRGKCLNTYIRRMSESKLNFYVLVGNHDWFNLDCQEHALECLKSLQNVTVVDKLLCLGNLAFLPYMKEVPLEWLLNKTSKCNTLIAHLDIKGFDYGTGYISDEGLEFSSLGGFNKVISGHYHKFQEQGNLTYLGTPFSHSFGESNQKKYIGIFDSKTLTLELLKTPFPQHVTIEVNTEKVEELEINEIDYYRVVLKGSAESIAKYEKLPGVKYIENPSLLAKKENSISELQSPELQFKKWSEYRKLDKDTEALGLEVLKDVF